MADLEGVAVVPEVAQEDHRRTLLARQIADEAQRGDAPVNGGRAHVQIAEEHELPRRPLGVRHRAV
jgi:hypothetical protein